MEKCLTYNELPKPTACCFVRVIGGGEVAEELTTGNLKVIDESSNQVYKIISSSLISKDCCEFFTSAENQNFLIIKPSELEFYYGGDDDIFAGESLDKYMNNKIPPLNLGRNTDKIGFTKNKIILKTSSGKTIPYTSNPKSIMNSLDKFFNGQKQKNTYNEMAFVANSKNIPKTKDCYGFGFFVPEKNLSLQDCFELNNFGSLKLLNFVNSHKEVFNKLFISNGKDIRYIPPEVLKTTLRNFSDIHKCKTICGVVDEIINYKKLNTTPIDIISENSFGVHDVKPWKAQFNFFENYKSQIKQGHLNFDEGKHKTGFYVKNKNQDIEVLEKSDYTQFHASEDGLTNPNQTSESVQKINLNLKPPL